MKLLIVVPAYNEAENIVNTIKDITTHTKHDYVIINDCSKDDTLEICKKNGFNVISLPINGGLTSGVQIGFKYAMKNNYDALIQFDGDGQHMASYIDKMFKYIEDENYDIVIGSRYLTIRKPWTARMLGSRILTVLIRLQTGVRIGDPTSGMRMFSKTCFNEFANNMNYPPEPDTVLYMLKKGKRIKEMQVEMREREFGESYLNPIRSAKYMLEMITSILFIQSFRKKK